MTGKELSSLGNEIIKAVNLAAFDICDPDQLEVLDTASPLTKRLRAPLIKDAPKITQAPLRKMIKKICMSKNTFAGAIKLNYPHLEVVIYLKRRITPAWLRDSPEDSQKDSEKLNSDNSQSRNQDT